MSMMLCVVYDGLDGGVSGGDGCSEVEYLLRYWLDGGMWSER